MKKKNIVFKTYNEAMKNLFPNIWKEEQRKKSMRELAESIMESL